MTQDSSAGQGQELKAHSKIRDAIANVQTHKDWTVQDILKFEKCEAQRELQKQKKVGDSNAIQYWTGRLKQCERLHSLFGFHRKSNELTKVPISSFFTGNRRPTATPAEEREPRYEAIQDDSGYWMLWDNFIKAALCIDLKEYDCKQVVRALNRRETHPDEIRLAITDALKRVSGSGATQERVKIKGRCKHGEIPGFCPKCKEMVGSGATQTEKTYAGYPDFSTVPTQSIIDSNREIHELRKRLYSKNSELQAQVTGEEREAAFKELLDAALDCIASNRVVAHLDPATARAILALKAGKKEDK